MARDDPQLKLRLTEELKAQVTESARRNGRSVNAEIVARLQGSFWPNPDVFLQILIEAYQDIESGGGETRILNLPEETQEILSLLAEKRGISPVEMIEIMLREDIEKRRTGAPENSRNYSPEEKKEMKDHLKRQVEEKKSSE